MAAGEGKPGDALIEISVRPHRFFTRRGFDILLDLPITIREAVLGGQVKTPTPRGSVMLTIPKGAVSGRVLRLRGKGVTARGASGDLLVTLRIVAPQRPEPELEAFLAAWKPQHDEDPRKEMRA
jgi:DnaJ-class molecular chaperone